MSEGPPAVPFPGPDFDEQGAGGPAHPVVVNPSLSTFLDVPNGCRWVEGETGRTGVTFPAGFAAAGVPCGLKESGREDLALLSVEAPWRPITASAAVFTRNAFAAAPVRLCREETEVWGLRGLVLNSGNANAATGEEGVRVARSARSAAASALGLAPEAVGVASTGVIGVSLEEEALIRGIAAAAPTLAPAGGEAFARALMTTDRFPKLVQVETDLPGGTVRIGAAAKGAGMIAPSLATMLCVVTTDAVLSVDAAHELLTGSVGESFNRISVDGEMSTNDSVFLLANGASGVEAGGEGLAAFAAALRAVLLRLALMMVADGEGATKVARIAVQGAPDPEAAEAAAWAVADSLLVKTALHGQDPNWGRVLSAAGAALADGSFPRARLTLGGVTVFAEGAATRLTEGEARELAVAVQRPEVSFALDLGAGEEGAVAFFSDIGHEYVTINADYHT